MRPTRCLPLALLLSASLPGMAAAELSETYRQCMTAANNKTVQVNICIQQETARQDARLNKAYQALMKQLDKPAQTKLRDEERRWIKKRDYDCNLGDSTTDVDCVLTRTDQRADELEKQLKF
jgi:uncharacterized protein YecT (DUF1311 family)